MTDPSKRDSAIAGLNVRGLLPTGFGATKVVALKGRWDFAQLAEWYVYLFPRAINGADVTSTDIQEARNRLEYGVPHEAARAALEVRLKMLDLPCNLIAIFIQPPITLD
jgi:hypothetical protein